MDSAENPVIPLKPNSIYVSSQFLISPNFHVALLVTDSAGSITIHEWAEDLSRETPERYFHRKVDAVKSYTDDGKLIYAYFKIAGYTSPGDDFDWVAMLAQIFPKSLANWIENRKNKISCRYFVLHSLGKLIERGYLVRKDTIADIEKIIYKISNELENELGNMPEGETYHTRVIEI